MKRKTTPAPTTLTAAELGELVGVTPRRIAQLEAKGHIPSAQAGRYPAAGALKALFAFYRLKRESAETLADAKLELTQEQARTQRIRNAKDLGNLISLDRHNEMVRRSMEAGCNFIRELPARFAKAVNPAAPEVGMRALTDIVEQIKARFRMEEE